MKYVNADTVFPKELLQEIQKYINGGLVYVQPLTSSQVNTVFLWIVLRRSFILKIAVQPLRLDGYYIYLKRLTRKYMLTNF